MEYGSANYSKIADHPAKAGKNIAHFPIYNLSLVSTPRFSMSSLATYLFSLNLSQPLTLLHEQHRPAPPSTAALTRPLMSPLPFPFLLFSLTRPPLHPLVGYFYTKNKRHPQNVSNAGSRLTFNTNDAFWIVLFCRVSPSYTRTESSLHHQM
jgi:hypothetical protein